MNVTITKDGATTTYKNMAEAVRENGATSQMSKQSGVKFLEGKGFQIDNRDEILSSIGTKGTTSDRRTKWLDRAMSEFLKVDKDRIAEIQAKLAHSIKADMTASDIKGLLKLQDEMKRLQNPTPDRDGFLDFVGRRFDEWKMQQEKSDDE